MSHGVYPTAMNAADIHYATRQDWQDIMKNRSRLKMHELIERLGLRAKWSSNKRGKTNFDSPLVKELVLDMSNVISTLPKETDELISYLSAPESLKSEVDQLLNKHGAAIWGRLGDREHLVSVGEPEVESFYYPRDLYFENEEDRELLRILLHWWIGLKACNVILARERLDRERKRKEERRRLLDFQDSPRETVPSVPIAPAISSNSISDFTSTTFQSVNGPPAQPSRRVQGLRLDTATHSHPISPASLTPSHCSDSPIVTAHTANGRDQLPFGAEDPNGQRYAGAPSHQLHAPIGVDVGGSSNTHFATYAAPHDLRTVSHAGTPPPQLTLRQLSSELGNLVANFLSEDATTARDHARRSASPNTLQPMQTEEGRSGSSWGGLDSETLLAFRAYIYPEEAGPKWEEEVLLRRLETVWREAVRANHGRMVENSPLFAATDRVFLTWIELRRHLADLDRADQRWRQKSNVESEMEARIIQHRSLMSASRELVRSWGDIGQGLAHQLGSDLTPDDLLVQAFVDLAGDGSTGRGRGRGRERGRGRSRSRGGDRDDRDDGDDGGDVANMVWAPMNVAETIAWLNGHLEQFALEEQADGPGEEILYVRS